MRDRSWQRRFWTLVTLVPLALVGPATAQGDGLELSVLFAPEATYSSEEGLDLGATWGLGAGYRLRDAWSLELRGLLSDHETSAVTFERRTFELGLRRSFAPGSGWRPFLQAGARQRATDIEREVVCLGVQAPCPAQREERDEVGAYLGGGVDWRLAPRWALRFDGRLFLYESDVTDDFEEDVDLTLGLVLRF